MNIHGINMSSDHKVRLRQEFLWEIYSWDDISKMTDGFHSEIFTINDGPNKNDSYKFYLQIYPNGLKNSTSEEFISIVVVYLSSAQKIDVELSLGDENFYKIYKSKITDVIIGSESNKLYFKKFINKDDCNLKVHELLKDDKLRIFCDITVKKINKVFQYSSVDSYEQPSKKLKLEIEENEFEKLILFNDKNLSDIILDLGKEQLYAHKIILANKSSVFAGMFKINVKKIKIADNSSKVIKEMLRFVYTGQVNNLPVVACELIFVANKYCIEDLKSHCERCLSKMIKVKNLISMTDIAVNCNAKVLREKLVDFIITNKKVIWSRPEFMMLREKHSEFMAEIFETIASSQKKS